MAKPVVTTLDLTREVPAGVVLSGLSAPKFDGVNYYREPVGQTSMLTLSVEKPSFVQLGYQLYSPEADVESQVLLDGKLLAKKTFPAGKFIEHAIQGDFVQAGKHSFSVSYKCLQACPQPIHQYWTELKAVQSDTTRPIEDVGLGVVRLWLYAPQTVLTVSGTGPLTFDGMNYRRTIEQTQFSWPDKVQPLHLSFSLYASQAFKLTLKAEGKTLMVQQGSEKQPVYVAQSFALLPTANSVDIEVECLGSSARADCASLYHPSVTVFAPTPLSQNLPVAALMVILLLLGAMYLFGLWPKRPAG